MSGDNSCAQRLHSRPVTCDLGQSISAKSRRLVMMQKNIPACACLIAKKKRNMVFIASENGGQPG